MMAWSPLRGRGAPGADELTLRGVAVGRGVDVSVFCVGGERLLDVAVAELDERVAFPGLVLSPVLGELDRCDAGGEAPEQSAGFDFGELVVVADEHDFRAGRGGGVEDRCELSCAGHAGFVDHDDIT
ncbi:MAG TPA: hypothetical protein VM282_22205 [Acidimicrobiales bacterium]|nr:hypothetical protein [Acidimicrobiales bacterium]